MDERKKVSLFLFKARSPCTHADHAAANQLSCTKVAELQRSSFKKPMIYCASFPAKTEGRISRMRCCSADINTREAIQVQIKGKRVMRLKTLYVASAHYIFTAPFQ